MPYFIYRLFLLTLAMKDLTYYLSHSAFNFSDRFKVFEFYFAGFLNGIIFLKFLILKLFQDHGATLYSDTVHLGWSSSFLHLHLLGSPSMPYFICRLFSPTRAMLTEKTSCIICLDKDRQENVWLLTFLTDSGRSLNFILQDF